VTDELARVVTDPLGRTKRRQNLSAMHQADDESAVERRRDEAVDRIRAAREELVRVVADVHGGEAFEGEVWSAMHVMWHLAGDHTHLEDARRIVDGAASLPPRDAEAEYRSALQRTLRNIDEWIAYSSELDRDRLTVHARRGNREYYVVGMIESTAEHLIDHVDHIRQIKERVRGS
jgi:hypothetical protein